MVIGEDLEVEQQLGVNFEGMSEWEQFRLYFLV